MKTSRRSIIRGATTVGVVPPLVIMLGVSAGGFQGWNVQPLVLGAALWVTLAMAFGAIALRRLDHQRLDRETFANFERPKKTATFKR
jgi:hypothetical protein